MPTRPITRLTLYGDSISGNCQKPKWTANYLGIPFDWVEVDILKGGTQTEDFLAVNPVGQVPVARHRQRTDVTPTLDRPLPARLGFGLG